MSRLKALLRVSSPSTCNAQQTTVQPCMAVAQHTQTTQQPAAVQECGASGDADDWGYELADLKEMDALINRLCDALGLSVEERVARLRMRRCMAPVRVPGELAALREMVSRADFQQ